MDFRGPKGMKWSRFRPGTTLVSSLVVLVLLLLSCSQASALPAFARKYGQLKRQSPVTLLNHEFIFTEFNHSGPSLTAFSWSH